MSVREAGAVRSSEVAVMPAEDGDGEGEGGEVEVEVVRVRMAMARTKVAKLRVVKGRLRVRTRVAKWVASRVFKSWTTSAWPVRALEGRLIRDWHDQTEIELMARLFNLTCRNVGQEGFRSAEGARRMVGRRALAPGRPHGC